MPETMHRKFHQREPEESIIKHFKKNEPEKNGAAYVSGQFQSTVVGDKNEIKAQRDLAGKFMNEGLDAVLITDVNTASTWPRIVYVNAQFTEMTGYSPGEIIGKSTEILFGPQTDRTLLDELCCCIKNGDAFVRETIHFRKDGSGFPVSWSVSPIRNCDGEITHYVSIQRYLPEPENNSKGLPDHENMFRLMAENTDDVVSLHGKDGSWLYASPSMERRFGYKPDEIIGKSPLDIFHPDDVAKGRRELELLTLNNTKNSRTHVFRMLHKKGHYLWLESKIQPVWDDETLRHFVVFSRDITDKKKTNEALKLQKIYFEQLFESSPEGIVILDQKENVINANQSFQDLFQYTLEDLSGQNINDLIVPDQHYVECPETSYKALGRDTNQIEAVRQRKDGSLVNVSIIGAPIECDNKLVGVYGIYRDITLQKRNEYSIQEALKEKEVLLKEIHHRVKNNMQVISSLHNLQARQIKDKKTLEIFKESQNRVQAMALIHDQLYKSTDLAEINFDEYVQDLMCQLFSSLGRSEITYSVTADSVSLDVNQAVPCGLIVNELVTNSLKHAFKKGQRGRIEVGLRDTENEFILEISDNGIGFPPAFDFRNARSSFGLQLVNGLVGQINGKVSLSTKKKTTFSIQIPK